MYPGSAAPVCPLSLEARGERGRTANVGFGFRRSRRSIRMEPARCHTHFSQRRREAGHPSSTRLCSQFQGTGEVRSDPSRSVRRRSQPLIERHADTAPLDLIFDHYVAQEATSGRELRTQWVLTEEHAIEDVGHVVGFAELHDCKHATSSGFRFSASGFGDLNCRGLLCRTALGGCPCMGSARTHVHDLFRNREDTRFARH